MITNMHKMAVTYDDAHRHSFAPFEARYMLEPSFNNQENSRFISILHIPNIYTIFTRSNNCLL